MSLKRNSDTITTCESLPVAKKAKVEEESQCFFPLDIYEITYGISAYLPLKDLYHFKLACKDTWNGSVNIPQLIQITKDNFEEACKKPGCHSIKLEGKDRAIQHTINSYGLAQEVNYPAVTDLIIDFCGNKKNDKLTRSAVGLLFPKLKSLKYIHCAHDAEILILQSMKDLTTLEIYTSETIRIYGDHEVENVRLCSTQKSIEGFPTIELLPWNVFNLNHGKNYKYYAEKVGLGSMDKMSVISGPYSDFVPNPNFL